jgi:hypothetical protein
LDSLVAVTTTKRFVSRPASLPEGCSQPARPGPYRLVKQEGEKEYSISATKKNKRRALFTGTYEPLGFSSGWFGVEWLSRYLPYLPYLSRRVVWMRPVTGQRMAALRFQWTAAGWVGGSAKSRFCAGWPRQNLAPLRFLLSSHTTARLPTSATIKEPQLGVVSNSYPFPRPLVHGSSIPCISLNPPIRPRSPLLIAPSRRPEAPLCESTARPKPVSRAYNSSCKHLVS